MIGSWPEAKLFVIKASFWWLWQCPAWHGSDSAWHGVTESVTRPSVRLSPPFRLLLSSPHYRWHNMQLCKTLRKVFCNRVEIFKCCAIFKVQSLWGFPQIPGSSPALLESARHGRGMRWVSDGVFSIDGLPFTLTSHLHKMFPTLVFCSGLPALHRHKTPIIPWHPNTRYLLLSFTSATLKHKTASFVYFSFLQSLLSWLSCLSSK